MADLDIENVEALQTWLQLKGHLRREELAAMRVLAGGVSSRTVRVDRANGQSWVLKQALPRLRVATDWRSPVERIHREAAALRHLQQLLPPQSVPAFHFEDFDEHVLVMEAVPEPYQNWKSQLLAGDLHETHVRRFGQLLGSLHAPASEHRARLSEVFGDRSFFESLRLEPYYAYAAIQVPPSRAFLTDLMGETRRIGRTLVHGDYSPKNVLVRGDALILLDHEVVHWGDPAFDLGFSITHLLAKALHVHGHRAAFLDATLTFWQSYQESAPELASEAGFESRVVRHTLACLLARVAGRSPLEYLKADHRDWLQNYAVTAMASAPQTVPEMLHEYRRALVSVTEPSP